MRGCIFKEADRTNKGELAFEVDQRRETGSLMWKTEVMKLIARQMQVLRATAG
jgi:hypothetical protein